MATAGLDMLELISCPVCKDIYTDPKSLKCRHTICGQVRKWLIVQTSPYLKQVIVKNIYYILIR